MGQRGGCPVPEGPPGTSEGLPQPSPRGLTEARAVGQLGPGVHLKPPPEALQQLGAQGLLRGELHDLGADEGGFEQGSWK